LNFSIGIHNLAILNAKQITMSSHGNAAAANGSKKEKFFHLLETHRFGYTAGIVLAVMALGGICMTVGTIDYMTRMTMALIPTLLVLCIYLVAAPIKWLLYSCVLALVVDLVIFLTVFM